MDKSVQKDTYLTDQQDKSQEKAIFDKQRANQEAAESEAKAFLAAFGRRKIKVLGAATLACLERDLKDWLRRKHFIRHLQIDHLPEQPACEQWQAIVTYYVNPEAFLPPKRKCFGCSDQQQCSRYQQFTQKRKGKI